MSVYVLFIGFVVILFAPDILLTHVICGSCHVLFVRVYPLLIGLTCMIISRPNFQVTVYVLIFFRVPWFSRHDCVCLWFWYCLCFTSFLCWLEWRAFISCVWYGVCSWIGMKLGVHCFFLMLEWRLFMGRRFPRFVSGIFQSSCMGIFWGHVRVLSCFRVDPLLIGLTCVEIFQFTYIDFSIHVSFNVVGSWVDICMFVFNVFS